MWWGVKGFVDTVAADLSGGHGYPYRQGQEPADLPRDDHGNPVSDMGVWSQGHFLICDADLNSGYRIISFISHACAGRRRYQIVFHDRKYLELEDFMFLYDFFISGRSSILFGEAAASKKSFHTSFVFLPICTKLFGNQKHQNL